MTESFGQQSIDTSVVVVGAGPTGLMLANWLLTAGVAVEVVDVESGPTVESRALGVQARTMEIYEQLGVIEEVLAQCQQGQALAPGFEHRVFGRVPLGDLGRGVTPYPRIYVLEQSKNERLLYDNLLRLGGSVRWGHRVTALDGEQVDGAASAVVTVEGPDQALTLHARYCVGTDGSSSTVRTLRGIDFAGVTNGRTYYVADAVRVRGLVPEAVNVRPARRDFLLTFPMGPDEHHRLIGIADEDAGRSDLEVERSVRQRLAEVFGVEYESSRWFSTYRVHHRIAAAFRDGPFFLAGDAAHVHSPVGAQGMNTGLQDAHNLALKLVDVLRHGADDASLDSYQAERRPVAGRLVGTTDRLFRVVTSTDPVTRTVRRLVVPLLAPVLIRVVPRLRGSSRVFEYLSQTRIHYWMTPAAQAGGRRGKVVGRRLRWTGGNFEVLRSARWQVHSYAAPDPPGSVGADAWEELGRLGLELHRFPPAPRTALRPDLLYLVRPDGFVAAEAARPHAVDTFRAALPGGLRLEVG
jgi:2-polyprenyl-6-methoxyphenol hydroxylase-like FAD-dependent oxidoreductase